MIQKEYLDYCNESYKQIYSYIKEKDIAVDHDKLSMIYEKTVTPYKYWLDEHKNVAMDELNAEALLNALKKKYNLEVTKNGFKTTKFLGSDDFKKLAENMRKCGYEYSREEQEFVKKEVVAHV